MDWNDFIGGVAVGTLGTTMVYCWVQFAGAMPDCTPRTTELQSSRETEWEVSWHESKSSPPSYKNSDRDVLAWHDPDGFFVVERNLPQEEPDMYPWWTELPLISHTGWRADYCDHQEYPRVLAWQEYLESAYVQEGREVGQDGWILWRPFPSNPYELGLT